MIKSISLGVLKSLVIALSFCFSFANAQQRQISEYSSPDLRLNCVYSKCEILGNSHISCTPRTKAFEEFGVFTGLRLVRESASNFQVIKNTPSVLLFGRQYRKGVSEAVSINEIYANVTERIAVNMENYSVVKTIDERTYRRRGDMDIRFTGVIFGMPPHQTIKYKGKCELINPR